jgi:hypothetical protein
MSSSISDRRVTNQSVTAGVIRSLPVLWGERPMAPFFCATATMGKPERDPPRSGAEGGGGRHPRRGDRHADLFQQRSAAGGRPAAGELRPRERGGAGAGAVRASSHLSVVQPFRADPRRGWDRCRSGNMVLGGVKGGSVL